MEPVLFRSERHFNSTPMAKPCQSPCGRARAPHFPVFRHDLPIQAADVLRQVEIVVAEQNPVVSHPAEGWCGANLEDFVEIGYPTLPVIVGNQLVPFGVGYLLLAGNWMRMSNSHSLLSMMTWLILMRQTTLNLIMKHCQLDLIDAPRLNNMLLVVFWSEFMRLFGAFGRHHVWYVHDTIIDQQTLGITCWLLLDMLYSHYINLYQDFAHHRGMKPWLLSLMTRRSSQWLRCRWFFFTRRAGGFPDERSWFHMVSA